MNKKTTIIIFSVFFICSLLISYILHPVWSDYIWSYGFSYNISKGLIIYKDFNAVPMPLYFILASMFIKIFGNYMISVNILDSILMAIIGIILFKRKKIEGIITLLILQIGTPSPYNLLCMTILFIVLYLISNKKDNDYIIAYLIGLIFITKQNIGILLFIPMIYYSKQKIKTIELFMIPFIVLSIFFLINHSFIQFIDYTILGLFTFTSNKQIEPIFLILQIIISIYLLHYLIKSKWQDKEAFYILSFQLISYPIGDLLHYIPAFIAFLYYFMNKNNNKIATGVFYSLLLLYFSTGYFKYIIPIQINTKKDLLYLKSPSTLINYIDELYQHFDKDLTNIYFADEYSYLLKLYYHYPINEIDLSNDGNWGYITKQKNEKEFFKICKKKGCKFVIYKKLKYGTQYKNINKLLKSNCKKIDTLKNNLIVYECKE